jgi:DNA-binding MarR family transcriptional regulator
MGRPFTVAGITDFVNHVVAQLPWSLYDLCVTSAPEVSSTTVAVEAWRLMRDLSHHPDVLGRSHAIAEELGVTPSVTKSLRHLTPGRPTPMRELAGALRCDNSYVTSVVDGLEQQGLARRMPHPTDRRVKVVELTARGAAVAARVRMAFDQPPASFASLSEADAELLLVLLRKLSG